MSSSHRRRQLNNSQQQYVRGNATRPSKRQRRGQPLTPLDHESLECVASPIGPITTTPISSSLDKELILERLTKEIVRPFQLSLSIPRGNKIVSTVVRAKKVKRTVVRNNSSTKSLERRVLDTRLAIGTNQCTRALENQKPSLVLLCRDVHPPTMLAHVPLLLRNKKMTSLVLLPGRASLELGQALGIPRASIVIFTERSKEESTTDKEAIDKCHAKIDSYIEFVKSKLSS